MNYVFILANNLALVLANYSAPFLLIILHHSCQLFCTILANYCVLLNAKNCVVLFTDYICSLNYYPSFFLVYFGMIKKKELFGTQLSLISALLAAKFLKQLTRFFTD